MGSALEDARAEIELAAMMRGPQRHDWSRAERALAALVEEIDAAPDGIVDDKVIHPDGSGYVAVCGYRTPDVALGQRVALLRVGENQSPGETK